MIVVKRPRLDRITYPRKMAKRFKSSHEDTFPGKMVNFPPKSLKMVAGSYYIPKKNELKPLGEDAHFLCADKQTFGVADGVGGWARKGVDAGEYARELMHNCVFAINNIPKGGAVDPKQILYEAFLNTEGKGSSTACILTLNGEYLEAVNVGDSGFVIIRGEKIIYKSPVQQRGFNCPYQLGNGAKQDCPNSAVEIRVAVEAGDVIVAGSDGLFDNVYCKEIEEMLKMGMEDMGELAEDLAWSMARVALVRSLDTCFCSPFATASTRAGLEHVGGKYDDITVIVAYFR